MPTVIADRSAAADASPNRLSVLHHVDEERRGGDRDHPGGEPVQTVDQVHRVHHERQPEDRERHGQVRADRHDARTRSEPEVEDLHAQQDQPAADQHLRRQLGERRHPSLVVDRPEPDHRRARDERRQRLRAPVVHPREERQHLRETEADHEAHVHRDAAHRRRGLRVDLTVGGLVDRAEAQRQAAHERRHGERRPRASQEDPDVGGHGRLSVRSAEAPRKRKRHGRPLGVRSGVHGEPLHQRPHALARRVLHRSSSG